MNLTASTEPVGRTVAPAVRFRAIPPMRGSSRPSQPINEGDPAEQPAQHENGTAWEVDETWEVDERGLGWTIDTHGSGRETKTTREILDTIDADTLRAARVKGGASPQIETNRDRIAALLGLYEEWKRPDEVYADEAWEICIIWRSGFGKVEIGTEEDGSVGYYVSRTLSEESKEGSFREHDREELGRVMSWLNEAPEEI